MAVEDARDKLIQLEVQRQGVAEYLAAKRQELEALLSETGEAEREVQRLRIEKAEAKAQLEREEALAIANEQARVIDERQQNFLVRFTEIAQDKLWYTGTGNDDSILTHQWQAMLFGAVAERWILGDEMGLGKTRVAVGWLDLIKAKKVLIVCQSDICNQFAGEVMNLAPHREIINLYKKSPKIRHEMLDSMLSKTEAVVVVNFEIWRKDKEALAKLLEWEIDTLIVDEAHNLKTTSTANYKYVQMLVETDNVCPKCKAHMRGLYDPEQMKSGKKIPRPCANCGWKLGDDTGVRYANPLNDKLKSKSIKNICLTTGTPILNEPGDLYSLLHLCDPVLFKTRNQFLKSFCTNNHHSGKWEFRPGAMDRLRPYIKGRFLARSIADAGITLPPQHEITVRVDLDKRAYPKQYRTIKQISEAAQIILDSGETMTIMHLIALITRKRQANVWPGGIVMRDQEGNILFDAGTEIQESVKLDEALEYIKEEHALGNRQVVFSQFKTGLREFQTRIQAEGIRACRFDGDTPDELREAIKNNFYAALGEEPRWDVVLANYKTGGSGLNLTAATATHIIDEEWNPGKKRQAYARTHRMGQTKETRVYRYLIPASIDTWMSNTIKRKQDIIDGFNGSMKQVEGIAEDLKLALLNGDLL